MNPQRSPASRILGVITLAVLWMAPVSRAGQPLGTAFTYQGRIERLGQPINDTCEFVFSLWDDPDDPALDSMVSGPATCDPPCDLVVVEKGLFTVDVDFGPGALNGEARWLQVHVACPGDPDFIPLSPRVPLQPAPYATALPGLRTEPNEISPNVIGGSHDNQAAAGVAGATIGGGGQLDSANAVMDSFGTVAGGLHNSAGSDDDDLNNAAYATAGGGRNNEAAAYYSTIGGGRDNEAMGWYSAIAGGNTNTASGYAAMVPGGWNCVAQGDRSLAAGRRAKALHGGAFVWADNADADFSSTGGNQFLIRAAGGVGIGTSSPQQALHVAGNRLRLSAPGNSAKYLDLRADGAAFDIEPVGGNLFIKGAPHVVLQPFGGRVGIGIEAPAYPLHMASGAHCTTGGVWTNACDRDLKENFQPTEARSILERVARLHISEWNYKNEDHSIRHVGPTAQDFHAAFGLGAEDTSIGTVDADGVALAAIQGLHEMVIQKDASIGYLRAEVDQLLAERRDVDARLARMEAALANLQPVASSGR